MGKYILGSFLGFLIFALVQVAIFSGVNAPEIPTGFYYYGQEENGETFAGEAFLR